jgi:hypothetical protein
MEWNLAIGLMGIAITILGAEWSLGAWINRQFSDMRNLVYSETKKLRDEIVNKIEYHERHDDSRFAQVREDIWEIRISNAARDGLLKPVRSKNE